MWAKEVPATKHFWLKKCISGQVITLYIARAGVKRFDQGYFGDHQTVPGTQLAIGELLSVEMNIAAINTKCSLADEARHLIV